jgi:Protein of unknown function (DUF1592)/Protein of unknown function (DUF1588)/Protein of unknown function (DUF1595)/Protein of unknown function (DUF1587)
MTTQGKGSEMLPKLVALALGAFTFGGVACTGVVDGGGSTGSEPGNVPGMNGSRPNNGGSGSNGSGSNGSGSSGSGSNGSGSSGSGSNTPGGGSSTPGGAMPGETPGPSAQIACPDDGKDTVGRRALRRLTVPELDATIRTAFGLTEAQWAGPTVPPDPASLDGFTNNVDRLTVGPDYARGVLDTGRTVAKLVAGEHLQRLLPCGATGGSGSAMAPCAQTFINTYGPKLYRRPLTMVETTRYMDLFMKVGRADFKTFVHWATLTMLQSPRVLYRSELGKPDGAGRFKLTSYEIASALSYTFTGGPPTPELLQLAAGDKLQTPEQIETAAKGLVYDAGGKVKPAFANAFLKFADDWMGLSALQNLKKDATAFPEFNAEIQNALGEETRRFIAGVVFEEKGTPASLLTAPFTYVNPQLAKYYGMPAGGADYTKVMRPAGWGVGLLAQGSLLAVESHDLKTSPTKRGYFVRTRLMCQVIPPPPPVVGELPAPTEGETTRERYEKLHAGDPACKGCHNIFDPIGFAFEHLDAAGRYREKEGRFDIDDSGTLTATSKGDFPFKGATELANAVAQLPEVSDCMASFLAAYSFGVSQANSACLVRSASEELRKGTSLVDFAIKMARSDHFRLRQP